MAKIPKCGRLSTPALWSTFWRTIKYLDFTFLWQNCFQAAIIPNVWHIRLTNFDIPCRIILAWTSCFFAQPSDWQAVQFQARGVWKSTTVEDGGQFVTTPSATLTPESFATVWDLGWWFLFCSRVVIGELHGDGDDGIPAESAGIPRGRKLNVRGSRGDGS